MAPTPLELPSTSTRSLPLQPLLSSLDPSSPYSGLPERTASLSSGIGAKLCARPMHGLMHVTSSLDLVGISSVKAVPSRPRGVSLGGNSSCSALGTDEIRRFVSRVLAPPGCSSLLELPSISHSSSSYDLSSQRRLPVLPTPARLAQTLSAACPLLSATSSSSSITPAGSPKAHHLSDLPWREVLRRPQPQNHSNDHNLPHQIPAQLCLSDPTRWTDAEGDLSCRNQSSPLPSPAQPLQSSAEHDHSARIGPCGGTVSYTHQPTAQAQSCWHVAAGSTANIFKGQHDAAVQVVKELLHHDEFSLVTGAKQRIAKQHEAQRSVQRRATSIAAPGALDWAPDTPTSSQATAIQLHTTLPSGLLSGAASGREAAAAPTGTHTVLSSGSVPTVETPPTPPAEPTPAPADSEYHGSFGTESARRAKFERKQLSAMAANNTAFDEDAAARAEAEYRANAECAQQRMAAVCKHHQLDSTSVEQFRDAVRTMQAQRPFFLPPVVKHERVQRQGIEREAAKAWVWTVDQSIFSQRRKETDARDVVDTSRARVSQFNLDFNRAIAKSRFRNLLLRDGVKDQPGGGLDKEVAAVRGELMVQFPAITAAFVYFSMMGSRADSDSILSLSRSQWLSFAKEAGIVGDQALGNTEALTIFVACNFDDDTANGTGASGEAEAHDDDAMMRFEFIEGLVRSALALHVNGHGISAPDTGSAVRRVLEECLLPRMPPEARLDPNCFRHERMYTQRMETVVKSHMELMQACYKLYKARDHSKFFWVEHWLAFLDSTKLLGTHTGIERREAKLIFGWSQALVVDELKRRRRATTWLLWDFIEGLCRLSEMLSAPEPEYVYTWLEEEAHVDPLSMEVDLRLWYYYQHVGSEGHRRRRPSATALPGLSTRPLAIKFELLMEYLVVALKEAWGGADARETAIRMTRTATTLSAGIELG